jgi:hypothetical protein
MEEVSVSVYNFGFCHAQRQVRSAYFELNQIS